jgi:hypothetical protein
MLLPTKEKAGERETESQFLGHPAHRIVISLTELYIFVLFVTDTLSTAQVKNVRRL